MLRKFRVVERFSHGLEHFAIELDIVRGSRGLRIFLERLGLFGAGTSGFETGSSRIAARES